MSKRILLLFFCATLLAGRAAAVEQAIVEKDLKAEIIPSLPQKEKVSVNSYNDYGWVHLNSRVGNWKYLAQRVIVAAGDSVSPYYEIDIQERFGDKNYVHYTGAYVNFKDNSYWHSELGFGQDITYVSRFQTTQEYGHRLYKNYFWQLGYRFLNYADNDVYIFYPGLYYYFGNHYLSTFYNVSFTEGRGAAQWGNIKGNFSLFGDRLNLWAGTALGQRLYDIDLIKAQQQFGYIFFLGANLKVLRNLSLRLGFSYSHEDPDFIKRSIDYGCVLKF